MDVRCNALLKSEPLFHCPQEESRYDLASGVAHLGELLHHLFWCVSEEDVEVQKSSDGPVGHRRRRLQGDFYNRLHTINTNRNTTHTLSEGHINSMDTGTATQTKTHTRACARAHMHTHTHTRACLKLSGSQQGLFYKNDGRHPSDKHLSGRISIPFHHLHDGLKQTALYSL